MFSRISVALKKSNAVTLADLIDVIQESFTPCPTVSRVDNIYDVKSWQRPYLATFKYHSHPHAFRFKLNDRGEIEMTYRDWANAKRKEWLPNEGPLIIMRELPPGKPAILKPDLKECPTVATIKEAIAKLRVRMSVSELDWWENMAKEEEERVKLWNSLSDEDYLVAGRTFDLLEMKYSELDQETDEVGEDYLKREKDLEQLMEKKKYKLKVGDLFSYNYKLFLEKHLFVGM